MRAILRFFKNFTLFEILLWSASVAAILLSFFLSGNRDYLNLFGSLLGTTALLFVAKGKIIGQPLCVLFAAYYGFVSYCTHYYGEMITYLCMSAPMAIAATVSWIRHPSKRDRTQVAVNAPRLREYALIFLAAVAVTTAFYFILRALHTAHLVWSTLSVATSFIAVALTQRRSPFYALAYAANDIVLIILWTLATAENKEYLALVVCFCVFLANDLYGLFHWLKMRRAQSDQD